MQDACQFIEICPIFERFCSEDLTNVWIGMYCKGSLQEECARRQLRMASKEVPITLLPNGTHNAALAH